MLAGAALHVPCEVQRPGVPHLSGVAGAGPVELEFHDVPSDGDCLFSAIALSAALTDGHPTPSVADLHDRAGELRLAALDLLCPAGSPDPDLILGGLPADLVIDPRPGETGAAYCRRMRHQGQWGSTAEILALTRVLQRPITVHAAFGPETYGESERSVYSVDGAGPGAVDGHAPLAVHFENGHYRAVLGLRGGASACDAAAAPDTAGGDAAGAADSTACASARGLSAPLDASAHEVHEVSALLDALHASASRADGASYLALFAPGAVFLGTDPDERWPLEKFHSYATARFATGRGWTYLVRDRHVTTRGDVAWFDEALEGEVLGACRGSGVAVRGGGSSMSQGGGGDSEFGGWRIAQYSLTMAVRNKVALQVAAINAEAGARRTNGRWALRVWEWVTR